MTGKKSYENLFEAEQEVWRLAMADIDDERYHNNELLPKYKLLLENYNKLLKVIKKIFRISDSQGLVLQRHQNEIQNLLDNAGQGFLTFGSDLKVDYRYSAECVRIFGEKIAGARITELLGQQRKGTLTETLERVFTCPEEERPALLRQIPAVLRIKDKDVRIQCKLISQPNDEAERTLLMMVLTDITDKLKAEEQIRFLSYHDKLTSLYNRAYVEMALPELERTESLPLSIIMIDMNALKLANDVFGHVQGDRMLVALAQVLMKCCRQTDIIARWGGDEFLVVLPKTGSELCLRVAERIHRACDEAVDIPIPLSAAFGTATKDDVTVSIAEMFSIAENRMYNDKLLGSREVRKKIITSMESILHNSCFENMGHSQRVLQLAVDFTAFLGIGLDSPELKPLHLLASLHDIGKVALPKHILEKAGPLTASEWDIVKNHSNIGYRMAQSIDEPALAEIILALHERWDGEGYPNRLIGEQIPFLARLFALVDVYDVITHERPYGEVMDEKTALREIESGAGTQFDPDLARQFIGFMQEKQRKYIRRNNR